MNNPDLIVQSNGCPIVASGPGPGRPVGSGNHNSSAINFNNQNGQIGEGFIDSSYLAQNLQDF